LKDRGLYILWLELRAPVDVKVGALGTLHFEAGLYAYVGSAQKNRSARIARHLRLDKPLRWHIDYLRPHGEIVDVTCREGGREDECRLVDELIERARARRSHPGFGAGDCRCGGHLLLFPTTFDIIVNEETTQSGGSRGHERPALRSARRDL